MDSNHRRRKPADLQSAPVGHLGNLPGLVEDSELRVERPQLDFPVSASGEDRAEAP